MFTRHRIQACRRIEARLVGFLAGVLSAFGPLWLVAASAGGIDREIQQLRDLGGRVRIETVERARKYAPIVWLASDERIYPMMPHPFAFDGKDNDLDGLTDLTDPKEILMDTGDLEEVIRRTERLREFEFATDLELVDNDSPAVRTDETGSTAGGSERPPAKEKATRLRAATSSYLQQEFAPRKGNVDPLVLKKGRIRRGLRDAFELMGIELDSLTVLQPVEESASYEEYVIRSYKRVGSIDRAHLGSLRPGSIDPELRAALAAIGIPGDELSAAITTDVESCPGDTVYVVHRPHPELPGRGYRYRLLDVKDAVEVYGDARIEFEVRRNAIDRRLEIHHRTQLPPPRVTFALRDTMLGTQVYEYWLYYAYDLGTNAHLHDGEHVFVFVDAIGHVAAVVGSAHTDASANNILVSSKKFRTKRVFPEGLPKHMPILVELGKHASAPDRSFDGLFHIGMDANIFYLDVWGTRDIAVSSGTDKLKRVAVEYSLPRDPSTLIRPAGVTETAPYLTPTDRIVLRRLNETQGESKFGPGYDAYTLFPLEKMEYLIEVLLANADTRREDVEAWLGETENRVAFWGSDTAKVEITEEGFAAMRTWAARKRPNRELWLHHDYRQPNDVFKLWLFPRTSIGVATVFQSADLLGRFSVNRSDFFGLMKNSTLEVFADFDLGERDRVFWFDALGLHYKYYRGSHQGWYAGGGWGGIRGDDHIIADLGYVVIAWDLASAGLGHAQLAVSAGARGEIHVDSRPWLIEPFRFQIGLGVTRRIQDAVHPLTY
jgi:hypothetical protein